MNSAIQEANRIYAAQVARERAFIKKWYKENKVDPLPPDATREERHERWLLKNWLSCAGDCSPSLKPDNPYPGKAEATTEDIDSRYTIRLGKEIPYNFQKFFAQDTDFYTDLHKLSNHGHTISMPFSYQRDAHGSLQSDHIYLTGKTGEGKTNCCGLIAAGFHRRPNPTVSLWISQKTSTVYSDWAVLSTYLENRGKRCHILNLGEEPSDIGCIPVSSLQLNDIREWLEMSPTTFNVFKGICGRYQPGQLASALQDFVETPQGAKHRAVYEAAKSGGILSFAKRDDIKIQKNRAYFANISSLLEHESGEFADIVCTAYLNHFSNFVANERRKAIPKLSEPDGHHHQHQLVILCDEFRELASNDALKRTVRAITRISTQGRQQGASLVLASQTSYYGGASQKVSSTQASNVIAFRPSSSSDTQFIMKSMNWNATDFQNQLVESFKKVFTPGDSESLKGRVLLFTRGGIPRCVQLDLLPAESPHVEKEKTEEILEPENETNQ
jgi:hypothetical protein